MQLNFRNSIVHCAVSAAMLCMFQALHAQFVDVTESQLGVNNINEGSIYGNGVSFFDFDFDGFDDLTIANGNEVPLFFKNNNGVMQCWNPGITNPEGALVHMILWVDYDNDDDNDLLITRHGAPIQLWNNNGAMQFENVASEAGLEQADLDYWGASFADYDHDGCLDLFICKYYHPTFHPGVQYRSNLYKNNCDGTFSEVTAAAGINLSPRPCFQSVFTDYNHDGWEDLFLVIDRIQFSNELFQNNGDGTFTNVTIASGINQSICSMTGTCGDFDQDLDEDIFVTNGPNGNLLMVNDGNGSFSNEAEQLGVEINQVCWGAVWIDYDNNSWEDLYVAVTSPVLEPIGNQFFINNEGSSFIQSNEQAGLSGDESETYQLATGDINNDGYYDVIQNNKPPYISRLWANDGGENHYISVRLKGVLSNKSGVGSTIRCHSNGEVYLRHTRCGENFISQNSGKEIFGIGESDHVDSLEIFWNSGIRDVFYNPQIDVHHLYTEGESLTQPFAIEATTNFLCENSSIELDAGERNSYHWSTGETTRIISVNEPGTYTVEVTNEFGLQFSSLPLVVQQAPLPALSIAAENPSCSGMNDGSISVEDVGGTIQSIHWSDGSTSNYLNQLVAGDYQYSVHDIYGCITEGAVQLAQPEPLSVFETITLPGCYNSNDGSVESIISGGTPPYSINWFGADSTHLGAGEYLVEYYDSNLCSLQSNITVTAPDTLDALVTIIESTGSALSGAMVSVTGGSPPYQIIWSNGVTGADHVEDLVPGNYQVVITDDAMCTTTVLFEVQIHDAVAEITHPVSIVFPNPFVEKITMQTGNHDILQIRIRDINGRLIREINSPSVSAEIDCRDITEGMYLFEIFTSTSKSTQLIIKHKQ